MLISGLNEACNNIAESYLKVGNESTGTIRFRTTAKGNLPHLSYILCKLEPLGKYLKKVNYYVTGELLFIKVHKGKEITNIRNYKQEIGATSTCNKRMTEETKWIVQKSIKGATKD